MDEMSFVQRKENVELYFMFWDIAEKKAKEKGCDDGLSPSFGLSEMDELGRTSLCHKILSKKMEYMKTGIIVPTILSGILAICDGTPGGVQVMLADIIRNTPISKTPYRITLDDVKNVWGMKDGHDYYPIRMNGNEADQKYSQLWEEQKIRNYTTGILSDNMVDTKEYWDEVVNNAKTLAAA